MVLVAVALAAGVAGARAEGDDAARDLLRRVLEAAPSVPFVAKMTLSLDGGITRELELRHKRIGDARASYLEVTAPLNLKDTRFLFFERTAGADEQFIYIPAMKRTTQVSEDARKQPFLGSEYYVSDLVTPDLDAFAYTLAGEETVGGRACTLVASVPKNPAGELYGKIVFAIDPKDLLVVRADFFDLKSKPLKRWTADVIEKIDGIWTPREQRMANLQEKAESRLAITEIRYNAAVSDDVFKRAYLAR
jgi:hypothetical protein